MNNEIPSESSEAPEILKSFLKVDIMSEEVDDFNNLLKLSIGEINAERYDRTKELEIVAAEVPSAEGLRKEDLNKMHSRLFRKLQICEAALVHKQTHPN